MRFGPFYLSFLGAVLFWGVFFINLFEGGERGVYIIPASLCTLLNIHWALVPSIHDIVESETAHWDTWKDDMRQKIDRRIARVDKIVDEMNRTTIKKEPSQEEARP